MFTGKKLLLAVAVLLVLLSAIGGTVAWLMADAGPLENSFGPSTVKSTVVETFDGSVKRNASIQNTGDTDAFIRAAIVVTLRDAAGNISGSKPAEGTDYSISLNGSDWVVHGDYYYHKAPVAPDVETQVLIYSCAPSITKPGYKLCVEILGSAIQSTLAAVHEAWGVSVGTDGNIV